MAICKACKDFGNKAAEVFSKKERILLLSSVGSMMRYVMANPNSTQEEKQVGSSATTKLLLSFSGGEADTLMRQLSQSIGMEMAMPTDCGHQGLVLS